MKKILSERYFSIIDKRASDISENEALSFSKTFVPSDDSDLTSLITMLSFFDNKESVDYVVNQYTYTIVGNIKSLIRDLLRESRKTKFYPVNTIVALIEKYYEAFEITGDMIDEILSGRIFSVLIDDRESNASLISLIEKMVSLADDKRFPLHGKPLSEAKRLFYKENDEYTRIVNQAKGIDDNKAEVKAIELLLFLMIKKNNGHNFDDILALNDDDIMKEPLFMYAVLFVYKKEAYDLLRSESEWLKASAIHALTR